jgi:hypothetical protein
MIESNTTHDSTSFTAGLFNKARGCGPSTTGPHMARRLRVVPMARADARAGTREGADRLTLPDMTMDQLMELEDGWSMREDRR